MSMSQAAPLSPAEIARLPHATRRHYGRWISTVIVLFILATIVKAFAEGQIEWRVVGTSNADASRPASHDY